MYRKMKLNHPKKNLRLTNNPKLDPIQKTEVRKRTKRRKRRRIRKKRRTKRIRRRKIRGIRRTKREGPVRKCPNTHLTKTMAIRTREKVKKVKSLNES